MARSKQESGAHIHDLYNSIARRAAQEEIDARDRLRPIILPTGGVLALRPVKERIKLGEIKPKDDYERASRLVRRGLRRHRKRRFGTMLGRINWGRWGDEISTTHWR